MADQRTLDMDYVHSQFPALANGWTFFDNAGGSQILSKALDRINAFLIERNVQIGGSYEVSQKAAEALLDARKSAAQLVNASRPEEIIFGASTTVLLQNLARAMRSQFKPGDEIVVTIGDHESNIGPWVALEEFGVNLRFWEPDVKTGRLSLDGLKATMSDRTKLVCVTHVSNIIGEINPIREFADYAHKNGAKICIDAVAYAPHRAVDVQAFDADYYVFSLYKTYGPHGAMMYGKHDLLLELDTLYHYFYGKDKVPGKLEAGNPSYEMAYSVCGIVDYLTELGERAGGTGSVRDKIVAAYDAIAAQENALTERLLTYLRGRNDCVIVGQDENRDGTRIPTIAFRFDGRNAEEVCKIIDREKIAIRFGDFHSRRLVEYMGLSDNAGVLRVSMVHYNTIEQVDRLTAAFDRLLDATDQ
ncbi:MAG: cysteine desulfurase-like protein [Thalassospira sp.]|uniref:cysteine desulfurase-like protein n=1 Tax=Thalassospira sp. TaxID=1912094 RepID=UPI001B089D31|nr:cysteine desulfurase-like protein [Thalassospira sp.]MBO6579119.1 cysteine desulfurase-like protein [Thalassospira sp.]MBO6802452.1 cysteine desulfurase-like protein [Thalassospira sp.]MBO6818780.1 cysteine desulfurase-like protein [Thalassospira sp.]MBO6887714.1 cysteine desulfurase-like protein [Thalassospira sp.]